MGEVLTVEDHMAPLPQVRSTTLRCFEFILPTVVFRIVTFSKCMQLEITAVNWVNMTCEACSSMTKQHFSTKGGLYCPMTKQHGCTYVGCHPPESDSPIRSQRLLI